MKNKKILTIDKLCYRYSDAAPGDYVFKNISYEFETGKVYSIMGKSGSGKTTLLSLISGLEKYQEGKVLFEDKELNNMDVDKYRSECIGIVFQSFNLLPHLTAIENIILSMDISKVKVEDKRKEAIKLLESVGLTEEKGNRRILKLSGGEQQRVAIARSLSYNPKLILADEPTGNLDKETEDEILDIFKDLAHNKNKCIIIVTHSKNVADNSDEVFDLKKGRAVKIDGKDVEKEEKPKKDEKEIKNDKKKKDKSKDKNKEIDKKDQEITKKKVKSNTTNSNKNNAKKNKVK